MSGPNGGTSEPAPALRLYVIRHAKAASSSVSGNDADRPLTKRGLRQACALADHLRSIDQPPALILTSGALRAISTAGVIQTSLGCPLEVSPALRVSEDPQEALRLVRRMIDVGSLALVGHNPQLSELLLLLVGAAGGASELRTGEAVVVYVLDSPAASGDIAARVVSRYRRKDAGPKRRRRAGRQHDAAQPRNRSDDHADAGEGDHGAGTAPGPTDEPYST